MRMAGTEIRFIRIWDLKIHILRMIFRARPPLRGYIDDASAFGKLIQLYEDKEQTERLFAFEVTMQNHGGYSKEYADLHPEIYLTDIPE